MIYAASPYQQFHIACRHLQDTWQDDIRLLIDSRIKEYTKNEVARHCTADDLWIIFDGKVYNMTPYFTSHPGGTAMLRQAGNDASISMRLVQPHSLPWSSMMKKLEQLCIGVLKT